MRKYFTWRCVALHLLVVVLVPTFLYAGWWQYHVALGGNDLSWVYTFEWPFFAVYAVYVWWKMIHDRTTMLDRLWAVKARAAADAEGKPLHQIPGWAMDKGLAREVVQASLEAARLHELGGATPNALGSGREETLHVARAPRALGPAGGSPGPFGPPAPARAHEDREDQGDREERGDREDQGDREERGDQVDGGDPMPVHAGGDAPAIDAEVVEDKVVVDEELDAYNRYLAELSWRDPPKRWRAPRDRRREPRGPGDGEPGASDSLVTAPQGRPDAPRELEHGETRPEG